MIVGLSENAQKQFTKLPQAQQRKIRSKLLALEDNPYMGKKLGGGFKNLRSARIWPYRILYEINFKQKRIEVHKIAHRQGAYK